MIQAAVCTAKYFIAHGHRLLREAPIEEIGFRRVTPANARAVSACPWRGDVRGFQLLFTEGSGLAVQDLLAHWPFPTARTLDLSSDYIDRTSTGWHERWAGVAVAVARSRCVRPLRRLSLAGCGVGDEGGRALADSPFLNESVILDLKHNPMSASVRERLRQRFGRRVFLDYADHAGWRIRDLH
jgi:hypothetical protein